MLILILIPLLAIATVLVWSVEDYKESHTIWLNNNDIENQPNITLETADFYPYEFMANGDKFTVMAKNEDDAWSIARRIASGDELMRILSK